MRLVWKDRKPRTFPAYMFALSSGSNQACLFCCSSVWKAAARPHQGPRLTLLAPAGKPGSALGTDTVLWHPQEARPGPLLEALGWPAGLPVCRAQAQSQAVPCPRTSGLTAAAH